jgi:autotransporter-associated beta strand protein
MELTAANSYSGGTTIDAGTLKVSADSALGAAAGAVVINNNAVLQAGGTVSITARTITLGAGGGTIDTNGNDVTLDVGSTVTGTTLTKVGSGTLTIAGTQTYSTLNHNAGRTELDSTLANATINDNGGTLVINADATDSTVNVNSNTTYFTVSQKLTALTISATGHAIVTTTPPAPAGPETAFGGVGGDDVAAAAVAQGVQAVPEPGALSLLLLGALGLFGRRRTH